MMDKNTGESVLKVHSFGHETVISQITRAPLVPLQRIIMTCKGNLFGILYMIFPDRESVMAVVS